VMEPSRRDVLRLAVAGLGLSLLSGCTSATPPAVPSPIPATTRASTPAPEPVLLRSQNVPGFYVRYYRPFEVLDPDRWTLTVEGLVESPQHLSYSNVLALPRVSQVSRMKCVECWSAAGAWEGFHLRSLVEIVRPRPEVSHVHFYCADGYTESIPLAKLLEERVLFVHHMNGEILPDLYGAPLRLMVPFLYGYKNAKAIVRLEFADEGIVGTWSSVGPYPTQGTVRRGRDNPLDLPGTRSIDTGVEIFYPDGIESQDQGEG
jgi:sulfoxide reductase catalytic subunit YedY